MAVIETLSATLADHRKWLQGELDLAGFGS